MGENPIHSPNNQLIDEEAEVADFIPPDLAIGGHATLSSEWRLEYLDHLHLTMEDPRFLTLPPSAQLLYLHFLKKTHGVGERELRISVDHLVVETKLAWMTVQKHVKTLAGVGVVTMSHPARQRVASTYLVHWFPRLEKCQDTNDLETRFDQLDKEDLVELARVGPLVSPSQRESMAAEIRMSLRAEGLVPSPDLVTKLLSFRLLNTVPYKRTLMKKYPHWYDRSASW